MCGKSIHRVPEATSFCSPLVKSEPAWLCPEKLKFESVPPPPPPTPSLVGAATSIIFVVTNTCLPRQNFCRDKMMFVTTPANDPPPPYFTCVNVHRTAKRIMQQKPLHIVPLPWFPFKLSLVCGQGSTHLHENFKATIPGKIWSYEKYGVVFHLGFHCTFPLLPPPPPPYTHKWGNNH